MEDKEFNNLPKHFECAKGAPIILIHNLSTEDGLINGSEGKVICIIYVPGGHPNHENQKLRMPSVIICDFPKYAGKPFFEGDDKRTWVPIRPRTRNAADDATVSRTQFPLTLSFAITPWKAQGMTLVKEKQHTEQAASSPGVLFSALTRVRHPDTSC